MATIHLPPIPPVATDQSFNDDSSDLVTAQPSVPVRVLAVVLVALLAFFLVSFPARNNDSLLHLAAGREWVPFFSVGTQTAIHDLALDAAAHVHWLYNLIVFAIHSAVGGMGLGLIKAVLVAGLAIYLWQLCRTGAGIWVSAMGVALAMLAMSPRLLLQPATVSCLLLAVNIGLLHRYSLRTEPVQPWLPPWPLVLLFLFWANIDRWVILGLAVTGLAWLGQLIDLRKEHDRRIGRDIANRCVWLIALLVVSLLNPAELVGGIRYGNWTSWGWNAQEWFSTRRIAKSPLDSTYLQTIGYTPAGAAYYAVLALSALSFVVRRRAWSWSWFLPWLALAGYSAIESRVIPFFALVSAPLIAWNFNSYLSERFSLDTRRHTVPLVAVTVLWLIGLIICAWPGWLYLPPYEPRRWELEPSPSLSAGAVRMKEWQEEGKIEPNCQTLHLSPETAAAFGWYAPTIRSVFDRQLAADVRDGVIDPKRWYDTLRAAGIDYLIVYHSERNRLFELLQPLLADSHHWSLLGTIGEMAVFGWRDPAQPDNDSPGMNQEMNSDQLAFDPAKADLAPSQPAALAPTRSWFKPFWKRVERPLDRDTAAFHLMHAEVLRRTAPVRHLVDWEISQAAGLVAASLGWAHGAVPTALHDARFRLAMYQPPEPDFSASSGRIPPVTHQVMAWQRLFTHHRDDTPASLLYLAIRAARRALVTNPDDAQAYLVLGESYLRLLHSTRERGWSTQFPELADLRRTQAVYALNRALALDAQLAQAHFNLGALYTDMGYQDLALKHRRDYLELLRQKGPPSGVTAEQFEQTIAKANDELDGVARGLATREQEYSEQAEGSRVADRADIAMQKGLAARALETLLGSDLAAFGSAGLRLELRLLLGTGRAYDVIDWMVPEQKDTLGAPHYHWLRFRAFAAVGDYEAARGECDELVRVATGGSSSIEPVRRSLALAIGRAILDECPEGKSLASISLLASRRYEFQVRTAGVAEAFQQQADMLTLRGMISLEQGDIKNARESFQRALELGGADSPGLGFSGRLVALGALNWLR